MGFNSLHDGLAGDQLKAYGLQDVTQSPYFAGSLTAAGQGFVAATGSPYGCGLVVPMTARTIISGGQFVSASGGLAYAAPVDSLWPIGIATATAQSGATVQVLLNGIAAAVAEGTIAIGAPCMMGHGAAQNCVIAVTAASGVRHFGVLDAVTSGGTVFITL